MWKNKYGAGAKTVGFIEVHEYILCYGKNAITNISSELSQDEEKRYSFKDENFSARGPYRTQPLATRSLGDRPNLVYPVIYKGQEIWPNKQWVWSKERMLDSIDKGYVDFTENNGSYSIRSKQYLYDENGEKRRGKPMSLMNGPFNQDATFDVRTLFDDKTIFDFSKPEKLIRYLLKMQINDVENNDFIALDFFAGSATTAHAIIQLNAEDGGNRKFIMVQIPEATPGDSESRKAGYKTIADIGKERIRRAGEKIKSENKDKEGIEKLDVGFKVFTLDETNLVAWDEGTKDVGQALLDYTVNSFKAGRTQEDVLYEILLKYSIDLTTPIEELSIGGKKVYSMVGNYLLVCLEKNLSLDIIKQIAELKPKRVVFYDDGFADDSVKANAEQTLKKSGVNDIRVI